jgi:hypothetical protein
MSEVKYDILYLIPYIRQWCTFLIHVFGKGAQFHYVYLTNTRLNNLIFSLQLAVPPKGTLLLKRSIYEQLDPKPTGTKPLQGSSLTKTGSAYSQHR